MTQRMKLNQKDEVSNIITVCLDSKSNEPLELSIINETEGLYFGGKIKYQQLINFLMNFVKPIAKIERK